MQADIEYIRERQRRDNYRFEVIELGGRLSKEDRIRLIPIFESGRFYLPTSLWRVTHEGRREDLVTIFVEQEYKPFPVAVHDDFFDAISRICDEELRATWPGRHGHNSAARYGDEPDWRISRIRLSDKTSRLRPRLAAPKHSTSKAAVRRAGEPRVLTNL
jgi:hypothetical protein